MRARPRAKGIPGNRNRVDGGIWASRPALSRGILAANETRADSIAALGWDRPIASFGGDTTHHRPHAPVSAQARMVSRPRAVLADPSCGRGRIGVAPGGLRLCHVLLPG